MRVVRGDGTGGGVGRRSEGGREKGKERMKEVGGSKDKVVVCVKYVYDPLGKQSSAILAIEFLLYT